MTIKNEIEPFDTLYHYFTGLNMPQQDRQNPNPERVAFLRQLPLQVKEAITGDEAHQFMFEEEIPESLYEKIKDYIEKENE